MTDIDSKDSKETNIKNNKESLKNSNEKNFESDRTMEKIEGPSQAIVRSSRPLKRTPEPSERN